LASHSAWSLAHSNSKWRSTCGTNLQISIVEMFLPMHVREPWPNCIALPCEYLRSER
jgi:hypothetical protein